MFSLEKHLKKNMLKWQVGREITCKGCGAVMDCADAVAIDLSGDGKLITSIVVCSSCFDGKAGDRIQPTVNALTERTGKVITVEITDGRDLFGKKRKPRKAVRRCSEVTVMGMFVGHSEGSQSTLRNQTRNLFDTRAVSLKTIWKKG